MNGTHPCSSTSSTAGSGNTSWRAVLPPAAPPLAAAAADFRRPLRCPFAAAAFAGPASQLVPALLAACCWRGFCRCCCGGAGVTRGGSTGGRCRSSSACTQKEGVFNLHVISNLDGQMRVKDFAIEAGVMAWPRISSPAGPIRGGGRGCAAGARPSAPPAALWPPRQSRRCSLERSRQQFQAAKQFVLCSLAPQRLPSRFIALCSTDQGACVTTMPKITTMPKTSCSS